MKTFSATEVAGILGISKRKVFLLSEQGILNPQAAGSALYRRYSGDDIARASLAHTLGQMGMSPRYIKKYLAVWDGNFPFILRVGAATLKVSS